MAYGFRTFVAQTALFAVLLGSGVKAFGQERPPSSDPAPDSRSDIKLEANDIVVPGERFYDDVTLQAAVGDISMRGRISYRPIPRYIAPLCLHVAGLADAASQQIKSWIEDHAKLLGLSLDKKGCKSNALVVLVDDPEAFIAGYRKRQPWAFGADAARSIKAALNRNDPAIIWFDTNGTFIEAEFGAGAAPTSRTDVPLIGAFGLPMRFFGPGGDVFYTPMRPRLINELRNGTIIFDTNRLQGFTVRQVADYAAMRLFGNTQPTVAFSDDAAVSILSMFEAGPSGAAPALTLLDRAYLQGIHRMKPYDHPTRLERSVQIAYRGMIDATCAEWAHCDQKSLPTKTGR